MREVVESCSSSVYFPNVVVEALIVVGEEGSVAANPLLELIEVESKYTKGYFPVFVSTLAFLKMLCTNSLVSYWRLRDLMIIYLPSWISCRVSSFPCFVLSALVSSLPMRLEVSESLVLQFGRALFAKVLEEVLVASFSLADVLVSSVIRLSKA